jgi:hypothetical protein
MEPITKYDAWELCAEIWNENRDRWFTPEGLQCRLCWMASKATPADRLVSREPDYRGCPQVNRRYHSPTEHVMAHERGGV